MILNTRWLPESTSWRKYYNGQALDLINKQLRVINQGTTVIDTSHRRGVASNSGVFDVYVVRYCHWILHIKYTCASAMLTKQLLFLSASVRLTLSLSLSVSASFLCACVRKSSKTTDQNWRNDRNICYSEPYRNDCIMVTFDRELWPWRKIAHW